MAAVGPMSDNHSSHAGGPGDEGNHMLGDSNLDWIASILKFEDMDATLVSAAGGLDFSDFPSTPPQSSIDVDFLNELQKPLDLSALEQPIDITDLESQKATLDILNGNPFDNDDGGVFYVDGGFWTANTLAEHPPIEAFAKLEFDYGHDFYMSTLNIVIGRPSKPLPRKNYGRAKYNTRDLYANSAPGGQEVKVPVFPPSSVNANSVSRRHLRIWYNYEFSCFQATGLSETGFAVSRKNEDTPEEYPRGYTVYLVSGDTISIGSISFRFFLPDPVDNDCIPVEPTPGLPDHIIGDLLSHSDSESDSDDDGDDEDEGTDESGLESREASHDADTPAPGVNGEIDDSSLMPPPPPKRGRGRPPKNGISVREQKILKRQAQEEFLANGGNVANLDISKYGNIHVEKLFAKEGERMQSQLEREARKKQKLEEKEAKIREKQAAKDLKPPKPPKERKKKRSLEKTYPYFKVKAETTGWQSSVRHNLRGSGEGGSALFERGERSGKGFIWKIAEGANIEKERRKRRSAASPPPPRTSLSAPQSQQPQMVGPPSANWTQAAAQAGQFPQPSQATQQYPIQNTASVQNIPAGTPHQSKVGFQPVPVHAPPQRVAVQQVQVTNNSQPQTQPTPPSLGTYTTTPQRQSVPQATVPPLSWDPSQPKQPHRVPAPVSSSGAPVAPVPPNRPAAAIPQAQQPLQQAQHRQVVSAPQPATPGVIRAQIPGPPAPKPPASTTSGQIHAQSTTTSVLPTPKATGRAQELLENPLFQKLLRERMAKFPGIPAQEQIKLAFVEYKQLKNKAENQNGQKVNVAKSTVQSAPIPKPPVPVQRVYHGEQGPQRQAVTPQNTVQVPPKMVPAAAPIPRPPLPSVQNQTQPPQQTNTAVPVTPQQPKPVAASIAPGSVPSQQRATNSSRLQNLSKDPKKKAEMLEMLKRYKESVKEKKAMPQGSSTGAAPNSTIKQPTDGAAQMQQPANTIAGVKRPAADAALDMAPLMKRPAIGSQQ
ncbi:hypothetical protein ABW19_dt0206206 [Dactylella cylindrospora]|nr:hypothetical protein ABW19_dt0206206 [Dactylella cylindrospora]